jgi:CubicO group peptidase (beta-lactamase class C family)
MLTIDDQTEIEVRSVRPLTRHRLSVGAMLALGWSLALSAHAATPLTESCPVAVYPGANWKSVEPAGAGWSREKLNAAREYSASIHSSSVMILEHGVVIDEWGDVAKKISSYSVRKSLISALYGIYSAEGVIDVNQTLQQLGIDDAPDPLTAQEKQARVVDLLRARSGVYHLVDFETAYMNKVRPSRDSHAPGTYWYYNNWDFNALGTIFEAKTGMPISEAFYRRIAKPIGMQDFGAADLYYIGGPISQHRAYHFEITARDLARFGLLYLRLGCWNGRQILPRSWVEKSSHADEMVQALGDDAGGYEYLWWVEYKGVHFPGVIVPPGTYSARGAGGHYLVVVPALDLVVVHRFDNDPPRRDAVTVTEWAGHGIGKTEFGHLLKLILEAKLH